MEQKKKNPIQQKTQTKPTPNHNMKPTKCPQNSIFVICFIYSRYWSRIQYEVKEWSRFCPQWHCAISVRVWSFFVIQLLKYIKKKKSLNGHRVWRMIQKNWSTAGPLRPKGKCCHFCKFSQVQCTFSSTGQVEGIPFSKYRCLSYWNHTLGKSYSWKNSHPDIFWVNWSWVAWNAQPKICRKRIKNVIIYRVRCKVFVCVTVLYCNPAKCL